MIIITGAAGFIGSNLAQALNAAGYHDLVLVDDFSITKKTDNWQQTSHNLRIERSVFLDWLPKNHLLVQYIFHLGARTDTTDFSTQIFDALNLHYSQKLWQICVEYGLPLVYASSAATYGLGEYGFDDSDPDLCHRLQPLNPYAVSKNEMDKWITQQKIKPFQWVGLKFFNVFGNQEQHKGRMASVVWHAYNQIKNTGKVQLFKSTDAKYADGGQLRDFIYVKDLCAVCIFLMQNRHISGIFNLGTGNARSFNDLAAATFAALNMPTNIAYIPMPNDLKNTYQNYTQATMQRLRTAGYTQNFTDLETAIADYIAILQKKMDNQV
jgi:ADP-L-glycero-D-manno-heptose 6-epimerase